MLKRKRGQLPWYMSLKIEKPQCWHSLHSREDFPVSSPHSSLHSYIFVYSSKMSSNLRFTESWLKCVYFLHKRVCLEQNEYTIFEETWNDVNGVSLLEWLPAGVYLKFWCIMKWACMQPSNLEFFPSGEKIHVERCGNDLTGEITVVTFDLLPFPKVCENVMWIKSPLKEKHTFIWCKKKAIWFHVLCSSLFRHILKPCVVIKKQLRPSSFSIELLYHLDDNYILHFWTYNKNFNLAGFNLVPEDSIKSGSNPILSVVLRGSPTSLAIFQMIPGCFGSVSPGFDFLIFLPFCYLCPVLSFLSQWFFSLISPTLVAHGCCV